MPLYEPLRDTQEDGGASVVVQPFEALDAQSKRYSVHAMLRGGAVNHDGRRKPGFTAPSMEAQLEVLPSHTYDSWI